MAAAALLGTASCNKPDATGDQPAAAAPQGGQPPEAFLDERLLAPEILGNGQQATIITLSQLATYYGARGKWRKLSETTWVLDADWQDELTGTSRKISLEFAPGKPTGGQCYACTDDEPFIEITRGVADGVEMGPMDIQGIEAAVAKANIPLPAAEIARQDALAHPVPPSAAADSPAAANSAEPAAAETPPATNSMSPSEDASTMNSAQ